MKKTLTIILVLSLILVLAVGCGGKAAYKDGQYDAESEADENGYISKINISVEDGKISQVVYDEFDEDGGKKSEDEEYAAMMEGASGIKPADAYDQLESGLVKSQDPDKIDAVSGATGSSELFKELAKEALKEAK